MFFRLYQDKKVDRFEMIDSAFGKILSNFSWQNVKRYCINYCDSREIEIQSKKTFFWRRILAMQCRHVDFFDSRLSFFEEKAMSEKSFFRKKNKIHNWRQNVSQDLQMVNTIKCFLDSVKGLSVVLLSNFFCRSKFESTVGTHTYDEIMSETLQSLQRTERGNGRRQG
jgi:hypothetical protein